jgi:predicted PurR-regulated permease PerM
MNELKKKFIPVFIPIIGILIWSLIIMINSFSTNETWRIALSTIGFLGFFTLTSFFVRSMIRKMRIEKEQ